MRCFCRCDSPLGPLTLEADGEGLTRLWLTEPPFLPAGGTVDGALPVLRQASGWLSRYWAGEKTDPAELPLSPAGSGFDRLIWGLLRGIPYGETTTYGALAKEAARLLGKERMAAQAVGGAVGRNPLPIILPCHRVVGADGRLTGYSGGLAIKKKLLLHEGIPLPAEPPSATGLAVSQSNPPIKMEGKP